MAESGVLIYTHPECTICVSVKMELDEKGKVYEEIDLGDHPDRWPELQDPVANVTIGGSADVQRADNVAASRGRRGRGPK